MPSPKNRNQKRRLFKKTPVRSILAGLFFLILLVVGGLSLWAVTQNQDLRGDASQIQICPKDVMTFPNSNITGASPCQLDTTWQYVYFCQGKNLVISSFDASGGIASGYCELEATPAQCLPFAPNHVVSAGTNDSRPCDGGGFVVWLCREGFAKHSDGSCQSTAPGLCSGGGCNWGTVNQPQCKPNNSSIGCSLGGCKPGELLICRDGKFACFASSTSCQVKPGTSPLPTPSLAPQPTCTDSCVPQNNTWNGLKTGSNCGSIGYINGTGSCGQPNQMCCKPNTYQPKCAWDGSGAGKTCTGDGIFNPQGTCQNSGKNCTLDSHCAGSRCLSYRPCCAGLTEGSNGVCGCPTTSSPSPTPQPLSCAEDVNQDGKIGQPDLTILRKDFGKKVSEAANRRSDVNQDGVININDFSLLAAKWGKGCAPTNTQPRNTSATGTSVQPRQ